MFSILYLVVFHIEPLWKDIMYGVVKSNKMNNKFIVK